MNLDWRGNLILAKLTEGNTYRESALSAGISRQGPWKRIQACPDFAVAVENARKMGQAELAFRLWLRHPFRGLRRPSGKGRGGKPRFTYGRR